MLSLPNEILLASKSPRRREIMKMAGFSFRCIEVDYDEKLPEGHGLQPEEIPVYLAEQKALRAEGRIADQILMTADTLVFLDDKVIGKPADRDEAFEMLQSLSGKMHKVITGVCLVSDTDTILISDTTNVIMKAFELRELEYYLDNYDVLDKAGAYGVQDWIGLIGVERMEGSYFNVMGLPIHKVYEQLKVIANH